LNGTDFLEISGTRLVHLWNGVGDKWSSSSSLAMTVALYAKWGGVSGCARALAHAYRQKSLNLSGASSV
jgi:hypothetical protein